MPTIQEYSIPTNETVSPIQVAMTEDCEQWYDFLRPFGYAGFHLSPDLVQAVGEGLGHELYYLEARQNQQLLGVLPIALVKSVLFGKFLVSLPYVNTGGLVASSPLVTAPLLDRVVSLADELDVKHAELRLETGIQHPQFHRGAADKVHMRLTLPNSEEALWMGLRSKVRNQIRKGINNQNLNVVWGREELVNEFYSVFCHNMRDLGTPPFSKALFRALLNRLPQAAEICVVRLEDRPIASALLIHGPEATQVPSASSLRMFNSTNANMLMYWELLSRAVERGQTTFDFGRSSEESSTYRFKKQWGASPHATNWLFYRRRGGTDDLRPNNGKFQALIRTWQRMPVWMTRIVGPSIVRGIP